MFQIIKAKKYCFRSVTMCAFVFATSALQIGCSNSSSSPSASNVKKEIEKIFSDCKSISIVEFEKLNGFAREDGRYIVSTAFTLKSTPVTENEKLGKAMQSRHEEIEPIYEKTWEQSRILQDEIFSIEKMQTKAHQEYHRNREKIYDQATAEEQQKMRSSSEEDNKKFLNSGEYANLSMRKAELEKQSDELRDKYYPIWDEYQSYKTFFEQPSTIIDAKSALMKECKISFDTRLVRTLYTHLFRDGASYLFGSEAEFTADISMIKTDNGWVMEEFWNK